MFIDDLFYIKSQDNNEKTIKLTDKSHEIFKAHFPTKPILPGFIHFEIISILFDIEIKKIKRAKFLKLIEPNQTLTYVRDKNNFKVLSDDTVVASFVL